MSEPRTVFDGLLWSFIRAETKKPEAPRSSSSWEKPTTCWATVRGTFILTFLQLVCPCVLTLGRACIRYSIYILFGFDNWLAKSTFNIYITFSNHVHVLWQFEKRPLMTSLVRRVLKVESPPSSVLRPGRGHLPMSTMATPRKPSDNSSEVITPLQVTKGGNHNVSMFRWFNALLIFLRSSPTP